MKIDANLIVGFQIGLTLGIVVGLMVAIYVKTLAEKWRKE